MFMTAPTLDSYFSYSRSVSIEMKTIQLFVVRVPLFNTKASFDVYYRHSNIKNCFFFMPILPNLEHGSNVGAALRVL